MNATHDFSDANIIRVTVETTGYCGGDSGHGGHSSVTIEDMGGTDIKAQFGVNGGGNKELRIDVGGDAELRTLIDALQWAGARLQSLTLEK